MKTVPFDELPLSPVRSFTYHNGQARADDVQRVIVYKLNFYPCSPPSHYHLYLQHRPPIQ
jgi:hypothetical protein